MKICPTCQASFPSKAALAVHMAVHPRRQGGARRRNRASRNNTGTNTMILKEYYGTVNRAAVLDCKPTLSQLPKLSTIAPVYELYKLLSWTVHFVHTAGLNKDGTYFAGVSYGTKHPTDKKGTASLAPSICKAVTADASISVPCSRLMGQPWLETSAESPGAVIFQSDNAVNVDVWISYRVQLSGPTNVAQETNYERKLLTDGTAWTENGQLINSITLDAEMTGELEIQATSESALEQYWNKFSVAWRNWTKVYQAWQTIIGMIHLLVPAGAYNLPVTGTPAILHLMRRPFRGTEREWERLRRSCSATGSGTSPAARE